MPTIEVDDHTATWWAAMAFQRTTPEFFISPQNSNWMIGYIKEHKLDSTKVTSYQKAFEAGKAEGKLFTPNATTLAKSTAAEVELYAKENGIPRYNDRGEIIGYNWPEQWKAPAVDLRPRRSKSMMLHPEDIDQKPSRRQWAMWGSTRCYEYLEATNQLDREIGADFFRD